MKYIFLVLLISVPLFLPLLRPGYFHIQDIMQPFRIYQMSKCLGDGQIPCRWVPDMGFQYGYPLFIYYAPGPYYLGSLFHSLGLQYIDSVKFLFVLGFIFSGLVMYYLLSEIFRNHLSAISGTVLYLYAPIRSVQVYVRGSLSEFLAFIFFPLILLFSYRLIVRASPRSGLFLALSLFLLIITHNLMSYVFIPIFLLWSGYWLVVTKNFRRCLPWLLSVLLGVGLSGFFLLPLLAERQFAHLETLIGGYFDYRQHFVSLYRLFISTAWGYGSSGIGSPDSLALSVGLPQWLLSVLAVILSVRHFRRSPRLAGLVFLLAVVDIGLIFLMHRRSSFLWSAFPPLAFLQFPWRLLVLSNLLTAVISAALFLPHFGLPYPKTVLTLIIGVTVVLYLPMFQPQVWLGKYSDADLFTPAEFASQLTASIFDYLPIAAAAPPQSRALPQPVVLTGSAAIASYSKSSASQHGQLTVTSPDSRLVAQLFDFPGMQVSLDHQVISHSHSDNGLISFTVPRGTHSLDISLGRTWDRTLGDLLSLLSLAVLPFWFFRNSRRI